MLATLDHNFIYPNYIHHDGGNTMRYRCTECGNKCTVSVLKGTKPMRCLVDDRDAVWRTEDDAPMKDRRMAIIRRAMQQDAKGIFIKRIDPADPWGGDKIYRCISDAARDTLVSKGSISRAVKSGGKSKAGDYCWDIAPITYGQSRIKNAAQDGVEAYREALKEYDPARYIEVFGEGE